jgi:predicted nucleic acid-binding protein
LIYLDSSTALAHLFGEARLPTSALWREHVVSSRLLEYELWNRIHARGYSRSHGNEVEALLSRVSLIELAPAVLARALKPFPVAVRTLDALHLATIQFLRARRDDVELASYDQKLVAAAQTLGVAIYPL